MAIKEMAMPHQNLNIGIIVGTTIWFIVMFLSVVTLISGWELVVRPLKPAFRGYSPPPPTSTNWRRYFHNCNCSLVQKPYNIRYLGYNIFVLF